MRIFLFCISFVVILFLSSCGSGGADMNVKADSFKWDSSYSLTPPVTYKYTPQLFDIIPLDLKLNKDELPFPFSASYLRERKIKAVKMKMNTSESGGKFKRSSDFVWEINAEGQVTRESKSSEGKTENSIERVYDGAGLLKEINILNPGEKMDLSIKKVKYRYDRGKLISVTDVLENNDSTVTANGYEKGLLISKITGDKGGIVGNSVFSYLEGKLIKAEFYAGPTQDEKLKTAIYTYTYTKEGKLLYSDHWYPGKSNDSYIFEFDAEGRLKEITYKIFVNKENLKIPGKTKSYRYEYENGELKRVNYFMQAPDFTQSGVYEFTYIYYSS